MNESGAVVPGSRSQRVAVDDSIFTGKFIENEEPLLGLSLTLAPRSKMLPLVPNMIEYLGYTWDRVMIIFFFAHDGLKKMMM